MRGLRLLALISLMVLLAGCRELFVEQLPTPTGFEPAPGFPTSTPEPTLLERRLVVLEWPRRIRERDSDIILLDIIMDEAGRITPTAEIDGNPVVGTQVEIPNLYNTHLIFARARLDIAGLEYYREVLVEPVQPGRPVAFRWSVRANEAGLFRGVVWLHLELIPREGGPSEQILLMARTVDIEAYTILGMPGDLARGIGALGVLIGTVLGYPFVQRYLERVFKRPSTAPEEPVPTASPEPPPETGSQSGPDEPPR
jgi:hypothetical protein